MVWRTTSSFLWCGTRSSEGTGVFTPSWYSWWGDELSKTCHFHAWSQPGPLWMDMPRRPVFARGKKIIFKIWDRGCLVMPRYMRNKKKVKTFMAWCCIQTASPVNTPNPAAAAAHQLFCPWLHASYWLTIVNTPDPLSHPSSEQHMPGGSRGGGSLLFSEKGGGSAVDGPAPNPGTSVGVGLHLARRLDTRPKPWI